MSERFDFGAPTNPLLHEHTGAIFSEDKLYRYALWRMWDIHKPYVLFLMLNPSIADNVKNDPTVEGQVRRLHFWHRTGRRSLDDFGGLMVANLFARVSTDWTKLRELRREGGDPVGVPKNAEALVKFARCPLVVCGWGRHAEDILPGHAAAVVAHLRGVGAKLMALGVNEDGSPKHPLYIGRSADLIEF